MNLELRAGGDEGFAELEHFSGGDDLERRSAGFSRRMNSGYSGMVGHAAAQIEGQQVTETQRIRPSFEIRGVQASTLDETCSARSLLGAERGVRTVLRGRKQGKVAAHYASAFRGDLLHRIN